MEQPKAHDDGDGTRRRLEPSRPAAVLEEDDLPDLPEPMPLRVTVRCCCICIVLVIFLSALTDVMISTYLVPSWGWFIFQRALWLVPIGAIFYNLIERLINAEPPPCMR